MKYFLLMTLSFFMMNSSFARFEKPELEEASRYEYSEFHGEQNRGIASSKKVEKKEKKSKEKERDVASDQPVQDASSASGIRYWKY